MNKNYQEVTERIENALSEKVAYQKRISEIEQRAKVLAGEIKSTENAISYALISNKPDSEVDPLYKKKNDLLFEADKGKNTISLLHQKISEIEEQLKLYQKQLEDTFKELSRAYLQKALKQYKDVSEKFVQSVQKIRAARDMLIEIGALDVYREAIGPAYEFFPSIKIPIIEGFQGASDFNNSSNKMTPSNEVKEQVRAEILK